MLVTIITDASYCAETKAAGYGYWVVCDRGRKAGGGVIKRRVQTSVHSEMMACCNGLWIACMNGLVMRGDTVLIQTDCQPAILGLRDVRPSKCKHQQEIVAYFQKLCQDNELEVRFKHVPGHTAGDDSRTYVNNVCDEQAKKHMRQMRNHWRCQDLKKGIRDGKAKRAVDSIAPRSGQDGHSIESQFDQAIRRELSGLRVDL